MNIKVNVTKDVLERSKMCGFVPGMMITESCMLALALQDLFPNACVAVRTAYLLGGFNMCQDMAYLPSIAILNRSRFDSIQPHERVLMTPFSFEIEVPKYVISKIGISQIYKVLSESSTLEHI